MRVVPVNMGVQQFKMYTENDRCSKPYGAGVTETNKVKEGQQKSIVVAYTPGKQRYTFHSQ